MNDTQVLKQLGELLDEKLTPIKEQVDAVNGQVVALTEEVAPLKEQVSALTREVTTLNGQVAPLKGQFTTLTEEVTALKEQGATLTGEVTALNGQVSTLGRQFTTLSKQVTTVEMKVDLAYKRIEKAQEETIETLSDLIHTGYELHEKRIKKLEDQSSFS